jgi:hypothetical protein
MSESAATSEDPFFSSIRALKAMIQSTRCDAPLPLKQEQSLTPKAAAVKNTDKTKNSTLPFDFSNIQHIRNVLVDLQSRFKDSEEALTAEMELRLAIEQERNDLAKRLMAIEVELSQEKFLRKDIGRTWSKTQSALTAAKIDTLQQQRDHETRLKASVEDALKEKSLRSVVEQECLNLQLALTSVAEEASNMNVIQVAAEQEILDLRSKLKVAEQTLLEEKSHRISMEQEWLSTKSLLNDTKDELSKEKLMRCSVEQERNDLNSTLQIAIDTATEERLDLQSKIEAAQLATSEERMLRLNMEQEKDRILSKHEAALNDMVASKVHASNTAQSSTEKIHQGKDDTASDDFSLKLIADEALAEREKQRREELFSYHDERTPFESPLKGGKNVIDGEGHRQVTSRIEERKKHLKEMDHLHLQLQRAISQRDSMEARVHGSKKIADDLSNELANANAKIEAYEREAEVQKADGSTRPILDGHASTPGKKRCRTIADQSSRDGEVMRGKIIDEENTRSPKTANVTNVESEASMNVHVTGT